MHFELTQSLDDIGRRSPSSAKATVAQNEMSSKTNKGKAPAASPPLEDTITISGSHSTRAKGKEVIRPPQTKGSSAAHSSTPSGLGATDDDTPAISPAVENQAPVMPTVELPLDQSRTEDIRNPPKQTTSQGNRKLPENLEAAQQEIMALRAANQELRRLTTPGKRKNPKPRNRKRPANTTSAQASSHSGSRNRNSQFPRRRSSPELSNELSFSDSSDQSGYSSGRDHRRHPRLSRKRDDPDKLSNGENPTYKQWKDLMDGKMYANRDWWKTEAERMFYIFERTEGKARDYLHVRWGPDSYDPFVDTADIFEFLRQNFTNPNEVREAKDAYAELKQGSTPFPEFRVEFLTLAMKGRIPRSEFKDDMYRKLNPRVRELLSGSARRLTYEELCEHALDVDNEVRTNQKLAIAKKAAKATQASSATNRAAANSSPGILPFRPSLPAPLARSRPTGSTPPDQRRSQTVEKDDTCHNCGKTGHWAKDCPEPPAPRIHEINELYPRIIEVDTDDEEAGAESQPENGDA